MRSVVICTTSPCRESPSGVSSGQTRGLDNRRNRNNLDPMDLAQGTVRATSSFRKKNTCIENDHKRNFFRSL